MDKLIDIANRAIADYGFRQAVLYGAADIARKWELTEEETALLSGAVLSELTALAIPVLKHRVALTFAARADGETVEGIIGKLVERLG